MPGIVGIVRTQTPSESDSRTVQEMMEALHHFPWYGRTEISAPGAAFGAIGLSPNDRSQACLASGDRRYLLAFEGELYNAGELAEERDRLPAAATPEHRTAAIVLHALLHKGAAALPELNGMFQLAFWDAAARELLVACDPGGLRPIYYSCEQNILAFAPEVKALLQCPWIMQTIDYQAILEFVNRGFPAGDRTFFDHIKVLPPGSFLRLRPGQMAIERYWEIKFDERRRFDRDEVAEQFVSVWRSAMARQTQDIDQPGSLLSGGLDSRMILAGLTKQGKRTSTFTMGHLGCDDWEIARRAAAAVDSPNHYTPVYPNEVARGLERAVYFTDGLFNCFHANIRHLLPAIAQAAEVVFDGISFLDCYYHSFELLVQQYQPAEDPEQRLLRAFAGDDLRDYAITPYWQIDLMSADLKRLAESDPQQYLRSFAAANSSRTADPFALVDIFDFEEHKRRFTAFGPYLLRLITNTRCPFYDKEILQLAAAIPPAYRSQDKPLLRRAICQLAPELANVPWQRNGLPLTAGSMKTLAHLGIKSVLQTVNRFVEQRFGTTPFDTNRVRMIDYDTMLRCSRNLQRFATALLIDLWEDGSRFFAKDQLTSLLHHQIIGGGRHAEMIGRILTVELWYRLFVKQERVDTYELTTIQNRNQRSSLRP